MRMSARILTVMVATLLTASAGAQDKVDPSRKEQIQESAKKVKELQQERIATLKQLVDVNAKLFQSGTVPLDAVLEARALVCEAELEAAEKQSDRITLHKNLVDLLKQMEDVAKHRFETARSSPAPLLKIRARRLKAEIDLERAKAKAPDAEHKKAAVTTPRTSDVVITQRRDRRAHQSPTVSPPWLLLSAAHTLMLMELETQRPEPSHIAALRPPKCLLRAPAMRG